MTNNLVNSHTAVGAIVYKRDLQRQVDRLQRGGVSRSLAKRGGGGGGASLDLQLQCLGRLWTRRNRSIT